MPKREVTEFDLRAPEFQRADVKPEDYEFRDDGKVVRKDRWETGLRNIASIIGWSRREYEIPEVVDEVQRMSGIVEAIEETDTTSSEFCRLIDELLLSWRPVRGCVSEAEHEAENTPERVQRRIDARASLEAAINALRTSGVRVPEGGQQK